MMEARVLRRERSAENTGFEFGSADYAEKEGSMQKILHLLKYHLHIILYTYFWFGLFVCGLAAPDSRVAELNSRLITHGWQLSLLSAVLVLPVPLLYIWRMRGKSEE